MQWHGTSPYATVASVHAAAITPSEGKGKEFPLFGRGTYTTPIFSYAMHHAKPLLLKDVAPHCFVKFMLLVMIPGRASPEKLAMIHKLGNENLWQSGLKRTNLQVVPLPEDFSDGTLKRMRLDVNDKVVKVVNEDQKLLSDQQKFEPFAELMKRTAKSTMRTEAAAGHTGEEPWSIVADTGQE